LQNFLVYGVDHEERIYRMNHAFRNAAKSFKWPDPLQGKLSFYDNKTKLLPMRSCCASGVSQRPAGGHQQERPLLTVSDNVNLTTDVFPVSNSYGRNLNCSFY